MLKEVEFRQPIKQLGAITPIYQSQIGTQSNKGIKELAILKRFYCEAAAGSQLSFDETSVRKE